jgi:Transposase zinc-binding domain
MSRPELEVADIFRDHGAAWRQANAGHVSLDQMKVMSAIERCRTAALGGHVGRCENQSCAHTVIAYNSCLMGKFRNEELTGDRIGLSVDFTDFALHYEQSLDRTLSCPEVKRTLARMLRKKVLNGFGIAAMRISVMLGVESTNKRSEYPASPKAPSRNAAILVGSVVMESKRQIDQRGNTRNAGKWLSSQSPTPHYGICP